MLAPDLSTAFGIAWIVLAVLGVASTVFGRSILRRSVRMQTALAASRSAYLGDLSDAQDWLLCGAGLLAMFPLGCVFWVGGFWFWPVIAVTWAQIGLTSLLRAAGIGYRRRLLLLVPVLSVSVIVGAVVSVWPSIDPASLLLAPWSILLLTGLALGLSHLMTTYSFPVEHREHSL